MCVWLSSLIKAWWYVLDSKQIQTLYRTRCQCVDFRQFPRSSGLFPTFSQRKSPDETHTSLGARSLWRLGEERSNVIAWELVGWFSGTLGDSAQSSGLRAEAGTREDSRGLVVRAGTSSLLLMMGEQQAAVFLDSVSLRWPNGEFNSSSNPTYFLCDY